MKEMARSSEVASFATASAISFPRIPTWPGTQARTMLWPCLFSLASVLKKSSNSGCFKFRPEIASSADRESEKMMDFFLFQTRMDFSARFRAVSSAVYTELSEGMRLLDF